MELSINIIFYVLGSLLAFLPVGVEFFINNRDRTSKPKWYKYLIISISIFLLVLGFTKVIIDSNNSDSEKRLNISNNSQITGLKNNLIQLNRKFTTSKDSDKKFQDSLFKNFGIIRNANNMPTKKIFNNNIGSVNTLNEQ